MITRGANVNFQNIQQRQSILLILNIHHYHRLCSLTLAMCNFVIYIYNLVIIENQKSHNKLNKAPKNQAQMRCYNQIHNAQKNIHPSTPH